MTNMADKNLVTLPSFTWNKLRNFKNLSFRQILYLLLYFIIYYYLKYRQYVFQTSIAI